MKRRAWWFVLTYVSILALSVVVCTYAGPCDPEDQGEYSDEPALQWDRPLEEFAPLRGVQLWVRLDEADPWEKFGPRLVWWSDTWDIDLLLHDPFNELPRGVETWWSVTASYGPRLWWNGRGASVHTRLVDPICWPYYPVMGDRVYRMRREPWP